MQPPAVDDTIVAVSSDWQPAPVGIIRLSGPDSFGLLATVGVTPPAALSTPCSCPARLALADNRVLPADILWFPRPRSYTGQDIVEIHTVGCLPLLRELSARLLESGARRALPGEFTARAFLAGRLDAQQVEGILALMESQHAADIRQAARLAHDTRQQRRAAITERIADLLALIEAGIDFVEEDDIHFITAGEVADTLEQLLAELADLGATELPDELAGRPHIAFAGLPNAGKSTLFNALLGYQRALVSPVLGTTRDVLSAPVQLAGMAVVFQDCAGLGDSSTELELAMHCASERAAQQADLILWVHAADQPWKESEAAAWAQLGPDRGLLVLSKTDLPVTRTLADLPASLGEPVPVSATTGTGMHQLRAAIAQRLGRTPKPTKDSSEIGNLPAVTAALRRALAAAGTMTTATAPAELTAPELVSLELRSAFDSLTTERRRPLDEQLLDRVFTRFCVGK